MFKRGLSLCLYGDTGSGKTTQLGELAYDEWVKSKRKTVVYSTDLGGWDAIEALVEAGIIDIRPIRATDDPWIFTNEAVSNAAGYKADKVGWICFDSGTSMGEGLLSWITKQSAQIGQQKTQKFTVTSAAGKALQVGANNESHYGLVQGFMLDAMWRSTWLVEEGFNVCWTFGLDRSEKQDSTAVIGPKVAGHALTPVLPKYFRNTFRTLSIPTQGAPPRHVLQIQEQPDLNGVGMSFANARYPLKATTPLPALIEPASVVEALRLIANGQEEAKSVIRGEMVR